MALTGIQIFKFLPKTNCKDCGAPTCLAFAMNLAANKAELQQCPHLSEESRNQLAAASAPPIRKVQIGNLALGEETELFRHEKTFVHQPLLAAWLDDNDSDLDQKVKRWAAMSWERVGMTLCPEMVFLYNASQRADTLAQAARKARGQGFALVLSAEAAILAEALPMLAEPVVLYAAHEGNLDTMGSLALEYKCPLIVKAETLEKLAALSGHLKKMGVQDMLLDAQTGTMADVLAFNTALRRAALLDKNQDLGYPLINFACRVSPDMGLQTAAASMMIDKYASIIVLSDFRVESLFPLLLLRLNIYTDPQRPMTMPQGIYPIGNPGPEAPVFVTTNFSLTYFIVNGEIDNSRIPAWLLIMDTEGLSVLTAWAAGKFVGDSIAEFVKKSGIADKINHRQIIIPGYVAGIKDEMQESLPGWEVVIGPREASRVPQFLRQRGAKHHSNC